MRLPRLKFPLSTIVFSIRGYPAHADLRPSHLLTAPALLPGEFAVTKLSWAAVIFAARYWASSAVIAASVASGTGEKETQHQKRTYAGDFTIARNAPSMIAPPGVGRSPGAPEASTSAGYWPDNTYRHSAAKTGSVVAAPTTRGVHHPCRCSHERSTPSQPTDPSWTYRFTPATASGAIGKSMTSALSALLPADFALHAPLAPLRKQAAAPLYGTSPSCDPTLPRRSTAATRTTGRSGTGSEAIATSLPTQVTQPIIDVIPYYHHATTVTGDTHRLR